MILSDICIVQHILLHILLITPDAFSDENVHEINGMNKEASVTNLEH
jgi:hypothetical protein